MTRPLGRDRPSTSQVWLDVVSAVDYLSQGHRPGLTVYDALEEALRWRGVLPISGYDELPPSELSHLPWSDPDPLRTALVQLMESSPPTTDPGSATSDVVHDALRKWVEEMSKRFNESRDWAHPPRPEPLLRRSGMAPATTW
jgi:hypothetical protein